MMVEMAASNTLIQSMVPDALRGRVMSVYSMMFMGMAPFGALSRAPSPSASARRRPSPSAGSSASSRRCSGCTCPRSAAKRAR